MTLNQSSRTREADVWAQISRCPECGRRVTRGCPEHGHGAGAIAEGDLPEPAAPPPLAGYQDMTVLARGGFGIVFKGRSRRSGATVAIKLARDDREHARRFLVNELRALLAVGPPHVPRVLDRGTTAAGTPFLVMEYLDTSTLAGLLTDRAAPPPLETAVAHAIAIVQALVAVHARGFVHCDLKPENIFIGGDGGATLIDFGLAIEPYGRSPASQDATGQRTMIGTIDYMSPEQCEGNVDVDPRSDVYAFGVILHELVTGQPPFWGPRPIVREKHLSHRPPRLSTTRRGAPVPPALEEIAARCLAKDRDDRYHNALDLLAELESARSARPATPPATRAPAPPHAGPEARKLTCGVVFFESTAAPAAVQSRLRTTGGQIAHGAGGRYAAVFGHDLAENPAQRALAAARYLVRLGVCVRARVDLAAVTAQTRRDGTVRFLSSALARVECYPKDGDPKILIAPAAAAVLPDAGEDGEPTPSSRVTDIDEPTVTLVGRDDLLTGLADSARRTARSTSPAVVVVTGEAGMGKSHLFRALAKRLETLEPGAAILALRAGDPPLGEPDPTLAALVHWVASAPPDGSPAPRSALFDAVLAGEMPLRGASTAQEGHLQSLAAAPGALRSALTAEIGEALRRKAAERPVFIILDDAHVGGDIVLGALEHAAAREGRARVWICAVGRPSLAEDHAAFGDRAERRESHLIAPLDPPVAEHLCRRLLLPVESVPRAAVELLVARSAGVPLLLAELVRGLRREGIVRKSPKGEIWYVATDELDKLPDLPLVEWLAHREIDGLAPGLRNHACLLALLGDDTTEPEVLGIAEVIDELGGRAELPLDARVATRRLLGTGMIVRDRQGRIRHRQALVRQVLERDTPAALRRMVHEAAAAYYRSAGALPEPRRLAQLAHHAGAAGHAEEAARTFLALAERAHAWHAYLEAERLYSRALEQSGAPDETRAAAHRGRGQMRYRLARYHDAMADLAAARATAEAQGDATTAADIHLDEATCLDWMDEHATSAQRAADAARLAPPDTPAQLRARLLLAQGRSAARLDRHEEAAELLQRAARAAEALGDEGYETRVIALLMSSFLLPATGRSAEAQGVLAEVITLCEAHGDKLHLAAALTERANLWATAGDREHMTADLERAIAVARELGNTSLELIGAFNLGEYLLVMDEPAAAAPHIVHARALDARLAGNPGRAVVALLEARYHFARGDVARTAEIVRRVRAHQDQARAAGAADKLMAPSEGVLCRMLELATSAADASADTWDDLETRAEIVSAGQERIEVIETRGVTALRSGRPAEARRHLLRAADLASRVPNAIRGRVARRLGMLEDAGSDLAQTPSLALQGDGGRTPS